MSIIALAVIAAAFVIPATIVTFVVGPFAPFVVGLLTRIEASTAMKKAVNLVVTIIIALVVAATMTDGTAVITLDLLWRFLTNLVVLYVMSSKSYDKLWKPSFDINAKLLPSKGLG
jgi:hypothetical protein